MPSDSEAVPCDSEPVPCDAGKVSFVSEPVPYDLSTHDYMTYLDDDSNQLRLIN